MFANINEATGMLMSRSNMTLGIEWLKKALDHLGNPHHGLQCIHVGGTNGKGSTTNTIRSILQHAGYCVGTFTSPHLMVHNDRIRINDVNISDDDLLRYINDSYSLWDQFNLSMFEVDMLISVLYFLDKKVDYVVYEVGLGGRLDATNVITPLVSLITNVDYDHMSILGNHLFEIAREKAGIIKENVPLITTESKAECLDVFVSICQQRHSELKIIAAPAYVVCDNTYEFKVNGIDLKLRNQGVYQINNAALALAAVQFLKPDIGADIVQQGIETATWAGRFEEIKPGLFIDGAHNMMGIKALVASMAILNKPWIVVFAALKDKEHHDMVELLAKHSDALILTEFSFYRAASAKTLAAGHDAMVIADFRQAIDQALTLRGQGTVVITGSLYFISDVREYLLGQCLAEK